MKNYIKYIALGIFLLLHSEHLCSGNEVIDSLKQQLNDVPESEKIEILNDLSRAHWSESLDKSIEYAQEALEIAERLNNNLGVANALNRLGNAEYLRTNYSEAIDYYNRSLEIRLSADDHEGILGSYNNLYLAYDVLGNKEIALDYLNKAAELSTKAGDKHDIAYYSNILGEAESDFHNFKSAETNIKRALEIFRNIEDTAGIASSLTNMGRLYQRMSIYDKAQECFFEALNYYILTGNTNGIASVKNNIGIVHKKLNNLDIALEYYEQSLQIYTDQEGPSRGKASLLNNIGIIWYEKEDYEKALDHYSQSLDIYQDINYVQGIATTYNNLGLIYTRQGKFEDARDSYLRSAEINRSLDRTFSLANNYNNLGELYFLQEDYESALQQLDEALDMALNINAKELISENYLFHSRIYQETNDFEKSLLSYEIYDSYKDSIYTADASNKIARLQVRYNLEKQKNELDLLQKGHDLKQLQIERQQTMLLFYSGVALLLAFFGVVIFGLYRYKRKLKLTLQEKTEELKEANKELAKSERHLQKLNNTKDKFFSIIAHDLKNPFNALLGFSETLNQNYKDLSREQVYTYIDIIYKSATNLYLLLENLLEWSRNQTGNIIYKPELLNLKELVEREIDNIIANAESKSIKIRININSELKPFADKNLISTVIRNLLNNAVKFTHPGGTITVSASEKEEFIEASVSDNGIGIGKSEQKKLFNLDYNITTVGTNDEKGTGLGLILCKEFVEKNGGELRVESEAGIGSTFTFTMQK